MHGDTTGTEDTLRELPHAKRNFRQPVELQIAHSLGEIAQCLRSQTTELQGAREESRRFRAQTMLAWGLTLLVLLARMYGRIGTH